VDFSQPWSQVETALQTLPGFGPWTRAYLAIRLGRDRDAFPASDIGLIRAANVTTPAELLALAEAWRPWRAYAAVYLWAVAP
jgi:DNA-3-methyladenine glycosylase II